MSSQKPPAGRAQSSSKRIPNKETVEALRQARDGKDLEEYASLDELKAALD